MIETHGANQGDVGGGDCGLEVFFGVRGGVLLLREPVAEIDAVAEMGQAALGDAGIVRGW